MTTEKKSDKQAICAALSDAGVSDAQITLALETSGTLLDQLASTPLSGRQTKTVLELFDRLAPRGEAN